MDEPPVLPISGIDLGRQSRAKPLRAATVSLMTAARTLGISADEAQSLAERGEFPCSVIETDQGYRVPFRALLRVLGARPGSRGERVNTPWTPEAIQALGPTTDLPTLGSIFGCSLRKAYEMARAGDWETIGVKIIRVDTKYRVMVPSILDVLGYPKAAPESWNGGVV